VKLVNGIAEWIISLIMAGGFVWAVAVWRSRRRAAALVATACALQLAVRLLWIPGMRLLFGPLTWSTNPVQRFFIEATTTIGLLSLAVSLGLLVFAGLSHADRKP